MTSGLLPTAAWRRPKAADWAACWSSRWRRACVGGVPAVASAAHPVVGVGQGDAPRPCSRGGSTARRMAAWALRLPGPRLPFQRSMARAAAASLVRVGSALTSMQPLATISAKRGSGRGRACRRRRGWSLRRAGAEGGAHAAQAKMLHRPLERLVEIVKGNSERGTVREVSARERLGAGGECGFDWLDGLRRSIELPKAGVGWLVE